MEMSQTVRKRLHPKERANILSRLSFFYDIKLFLNGCRKSWENEDLFEVLKDCRAQDLGDNLEKNWNLEKNKDKPSICRVLWKCFGRNFIVLGFVQFFIRIIVTVFLPQSLSKLVAYFSPAQEELTKKEATFYGCTIIVVCILNLFFYYYCMLALTELGTKVRTAICSLLYRKSLKLSSESLSKVGLGKIVTIMTKDVDTLSSFIYYGNDVWIGLIQTVVICYLIYSKIGVAAFAGIGFFVIILPLQIFIGKLGYGLRLRSSRKTDERLESIQEVLSSIKIIKMYTWEKFFEKKINSTRKQELKKLHKLFFTKVWITIIGNISSKTAFFIFFMTYVWMGNYDGNVTAEIIYYIISCFGDMEYSFSTLIPLSLSYTSEAYATLKRVENILTAKELSSKRNISSDSKSHISFKGVSAKIGKKDIFENISLNIDEGLNVCVGPIGSGKTSFLKMIMKELEMDGEIDISGRISYASQEPWLFQSTVRNNITFGEKYDEKKYKEILRLCDLDCDLRQLVDGDSTIIGDAGINLSKGQRTRINLARALYKDSDIYLLDDCLASLDAHVSDHIFNECLCEFLKNKICIFVTNNVRFVRKADKILTINGDGSLQITGKFESDCNWNDEPRDEKDSEKVKKELDEKTEIFHENKKCGKVSLNDYYQYVRYGGGIFIFFLVLSLFIAAQGLSNYSDKMISDWITLEQDIALRKIENATNVGDFQKKRNDKLNFYILIVITSTALSIIKFFAFFNFSRIASINLHEAMVQNVLNSTIKFFDSNFLGNILNRFSKDCLVVDEELPFVVVECLEMVFTVCGGIILLSTVNYIFLIESLCLIVFAYLLKRFCQPTGRNLQRLNVAVRSPMIGHLYSTLEGLTTIRANNAQEKVTAEFDNYQNVFTSANYTLKNCNLALEFGLEMFCDLFIIAIIVQFLQIDIDSTVGDVGLVITQCFIITDIISSGIKYISECENLMTCVERMIEYTTIEQESKKGLIINDWPFKGSVSFKQVSLCYNHNNKILENISFDIKPKEKVGIVGRTGAGKSSIISTLLRLYEIEGKIEIDDFDIRNVDLVSLRSSLSIIPQDSFVFSGTIRENLDLKGLHTDQEIWKIVGELGLKDRITDLDLKVDKKFSFSAGQKQLFCLARVILGKRKIVVLDEATANVGRETEDLMEKAIEKNFAESTMIVIAHKLSSVLRCDKILVLDEGKISEFGEPSSLLKNKNSFLYNANNLL